MEVMNGIFFHAIGASSASLCYTPQKAVRGWSWQTYWLAQAAVCWLLLPLFVAWLTIPQLMEVLLHAPASAMRNSFLLGMGYGVGGTAFGLAIRYVGFSLTYAIAVGISCVLGTLLPVLMDGNIGEIMKGQGSGFLVSGISMGAIGILICGWAGRSKEIDLEKQENKKGNFSLAKGLPLCILAGVLSALYGYSLHVGKPISEMAARYGAGNFQGNVIYIFSNTGAFVTTLFYCLYLHRKENTFGEHAAARGGSLSINYLLAALTGFLWYGQFFFYGLGHVRMGRFEFSSWAIHMVLLVLLSTVAGLLLREWKYSTAKTKWLLTVAIITLIIAILLLTEGNRLGGVG